MEGPAAVERRIVSVLFADLVGFTALSERLDPEDVAATQDAYFAVVRETVGRHGGVLEKFIGDAAMAVFGVPRTREDDAERAVRTGLALAAAVEALGPRLGMEEAALQVRIGVTTGEVALAVDGPDAGRVTGDIVNVAARLQAAAPIGRVLLSKASALAVAETIETGPTIALELKGKAEPVRTALAIGPRAAPSRELAMGALHAELIGRDAELRWFREQLAAVPEGHTRTALVVAPPGTGKSRFVADAGTAALRDGSVDAVWTARLRPGGAPFDGLREIANAAMQPAPLEEQLAHGGLAPGRARVVADALRSLVDPTPTQASAASAPAVTDWLDGLDALGAGRRVAWDIEDLHWAGSDLLAFLAQLVDRPIALGGKRLVVGTARPAFAPAESDFPGMARLELPPLAPSAARDLVIALVGDALPASVVDAISLRSAGNALFVEELLRTWVAAGALVMEPAGVWRLAVAHAQVSIPPTVQAVYAAQLDDLAPAARHALRRASVAGRRFPVAALPTLDVPDAAATVAGLVRSGAVTGPTVDDLTGDVYAYRHALLRDAAYASLARAERARLHVALARWLEAVAADRLDDAAAEIGAHYATALEVAPALSRTVGSDLEREDAARLATVWLERAGDRALAGSAPRAAAELYRAALRVVADDAPIARARLLLHLGMATAITADLTESAALLQEAMAGFRALLHGDARQPARDGLAEAADALSRARYEQIRFADARALAEQVLAELGDPVDDGPDLARARLMMRAAIADHADTDADTSDALLGVVATARLAGDRRLGLDAIILARVVGVELGLPDPIGSSEIRALAAELGEWGTVCDQLIDRGLELADVYPAEALRILDEAAALAEERGFTEQAGWVDYARSEALAVSGDLASAAEAAGRAVALAERNAYLRLAVRSYHVLVPVAAARGNLEPAERLAAFYAAREGNFPDSGYARIMRGAMDLFIAPARRRPGGPLPVGPRLPALAKGISGASWVLAIERSLDYWLGNRALDEANQAIDQMDAARHTSQTTDFGRAALDLMVARLRAAEGRVDEAEARARAGLAAFRAIPAPWWVARALDILAAAGRAGASELDELAALKTELGLA